MKYLVIARYFIRDEVWKTHQREFNNLDAAEEWATQMYDGVHADRGEEVTVLLYELKKFYN